MQKYPNQTFLVRNLRIFTFEPTLQQDKVKDADFKYDKAFSYSSTKILKSGIFGTKFRHSCSRNFAIRQIRSVGFQYDNSIFKFHPQKYANQDCPKFKNCYFAPDFAIRQIRG